MPLSRPSETEIVASPQTTPMMISCHRAFSGTPMTWARPPLICSVPRPIETAMPKTVPMMATTSIVLPMGPWIFSPRMGWKIELTRGGRFLLWMK